MCAHLRFVVRLWIYDLRVRCSYAYLRDIAAAKWIWIQEPATMSYDLIYSVIFVFFSRQFCRCWDRCEQIEQWQLVAFGSFVIWRDTASCTQWHRVHAQQTLCSDTFDEVQRITDLPCVSCVEDLKCMGNAMMGSIHQSCATLFNCIHFWWICVLSRWVERPLYPCHK